MKQNYVTMIKTIDDKNVKHISLLVLKISFLTLFGCDVKITRLILYLGAESKFPHLYFSLILEIDLLTLSMGMGFKLSPFINPKCG